MTLNNKNTLLITYSWYLLMFDEFIVCAVQRPRFIQFTFIATSQPAHFTSGFQRLAAEYNGAKQTEEISVSGRDPTQHPRNGAARRRTYVSSPEKYDAVVSATRVVGWKCARRLPPSVYAALDVHGDASREILLTLTPARRETRGLSYGCELPRSWKHLDFTYFNWMRAPFPSSPAHHPRTYR